MKLLITESNNYYRRGDPFFFPYKDVKLGDGTWPAILLKLTSPMGRPDIIETNGVLLYNGLYLDEHMTVRITKYHATIVELPAWARKADVWFISNQPVNMPSHRVTSSWRAIPVAPAAAAGRLRSLLDDSCEYIVPDLHTDRIVANGAGGTSEVNEETLMVVGSCDLSLKATKKYYNKELISFKLFDKNSISQPLDSFLPDALKVERLFVGLSAGYVVAEYNAEDGLFRAYRLPVGGKTRVVRLLGRPDERGFPVVECPATHKRLTELFPANKLLKELSDTPRLERGWHRTPEEVAVAIPGVALPITYVPIADVDDCIRRHDYVLVATPPFIPPLITLRPSKNVIVHETAVLDARGTIERVPRTPLTEMLRGLKALALEQTGPCEQKAQNTFRHGIIRRALELKAPEDALTQYMTVSFDNFGCENLFSLDIADSLDMLNPSENVIGYVYERAKDEKPEGPTRREASSLIDTLGISQTRYLEFAEHPTKDNEILHSFANNITTLSFGVRWYSAGGSMTAGVPLAPPAGREEDIYLLQEGAWCDVGRLSDVTAGAIAAAFPFVMDKKYR